MEFPVNRFWLPTAVALIVAGLSYGVFEATRPSPVPDGFLYGNGHVEGTEVRVSSEVPGRVVEHRLEEGNQVLRDDTVVVIESQSSIDLLQAAQAELTALQQSRGSLESQRELWEHHAETAARQRARVRDLRASALASDSDVDQAENALEEARQQARALKAQSAALQEQIAAAKARVGLAETRLSNHDIEAPADGTVLIRAIEVGEVVQPGAPLALIVDLDRLELKVYVPERYIGKIRLGNPARIAVNAFPDRFFDAQVSRVDDYAQFTPRDIHVPEERTRMVYGVTLALEDSGGRLKPGMPADAWIRWDDAKSWASCCPAP